MLILTVLLFYHYCAFKAAKQREIARRSSSKELTDAQRELAEKQNKKLKDKIEKEKREEAEYKKRVKQALEEDKARRKAEKERAQAAAAAAKAQSAPAPEEVLTPSDIRAQNAGLAQARNDAAPALAFDSSRLNIRLFDGSSIRNTFKATDTLQDVRNWINEVLGNRTVGDFSSLQRHCYQHLTYYFLSHPLIFSRV